MKTSKKTVTTMKFSVYTSWDDINEGACRKPHKCMEKLAIARALLKIHPSASNVNVDAAKIKFRLNGYHWSADTPKLAKYSLIQFDMKKPVEPHSYAVVATRGYKIPSVSAERRQQMKDAYRARLAAGRTNNKTRNLTLHDRVVGFR